jgi:DNA-binding XRE family transcriptional regulator
VTTLEDVDVDAVHAGERISVLEVIGNQESELYDPGSGYDNVPKVTCPCGNRITWNFAYRCFYCEVIFCQSCAEDHFEEDVDSHGYIDAAAFNVPTRDEFHAARLEAGVTQVELAEAIDISNSTISAYERGRSDLQLENLRAALDYLESQGASP